MTPTPASPEPGHVRVDPCAEHADCWRLTWREFHGAHTAEVTGPRAAARARYLAKALAYALDLERRAIAAVMAGE